LEIDAFWRLFFLNETTRFIRNDAVSYIFLFKKKVQNSVVLNDIIPLSPSPGRAAGEEKPFFFLLLLSSSFPATRVPCERPEAPRTLMMRNQGQHALPAAPTGQPTGAALPHA
jgi:hypothetical protein